MSCHLINPKEKINDETWNSVEENKDNNGETEADATTYGEVNGEQTQFKMYLGGWN